MGAVSVLMENKYAVAVGLLQDRNGPRGLCWLGLRPEWEMFEACLCFKRDMTLTSYTPDRYSTYDHMAATGFLIAISGTALMNIVPER